MVAGREDANDVFDIDRQHPEYILRKFAWKKYRDLYAGGEQFQANAGDYLVRRQKEPGEVYGERLSKVFYENYIGSIVDWYAATLFRREPAVTYDGADQPARSFYATLINDADRKGTRFTDFFRRQFIESLIAGGSFVLVDFPNLGVRGGTRAEEDATGASRAYLVEYPADSVINWSQDEWGNYEWVVIRSQTVKKDRVEDAQWHMETRWAYYDKQNFRIYRQTQDGTGSGSPALVDEGMHGLAKLNQVPLFELRIPEGLWMLNRAASLQMEHFNKSNALSWALTMGLFAMPVVYSDREWSQVVGESYYIQLGPDDKFGWTEPEGRVFQIAADNLKRLQEEIYRVCYLTQAGGSLDGSGQQSGLSKQRDFSITQEVLRAYGDTVKDQMRRVLEAIRLAREDAVEIGVAGLDEFDIADFASELEDAKNLLQLGVESPTLKKEIFKKLALKYMSDARQEVKARIALEIETAEAGGGSDGRGK